MKLNYSTVELKQTFGDYLNVLTTHEDKLDTLTSQSVISAKEKRLDLVEEVFPVIYQNAKFNLQGLNVSTISKKLLGHSRATYYFREMYDHFNLGSDFLEGKKEELLKERNDEGQKLHFSEARVELLKECLASDQKKYTELELSITQLLWRLEQYVSAEIIHSGVISDWAELSVMEQSLSVSPTALLKSGKIRKTYYTKVCKLASYNRAYLDKIDRLCATSQKNVNSWSLIEMADFCENLKNNTLLENYQLYLAKTEEQKVVSKYLKDCPVQIEQLEQDIVKAKKRIQLNEEIIKETKKDYSHLTTEERIMHLLKISLSEDLAGKKHTPYAFDFLIQTSTWANMKKNSEDLTVLTTLIAKQEALGIIESHTERETTELKKILEKIKRFRIDLEQLIIKLESEDTPNMVSFDLYPVEHQFNQYRDIASSCLETCSKRYRKSMELYEYYYNSNFIWVSPSVASLNNSDNKIKLSYDLFKEEIKEELNKNPLVERNTTFDTITDKMNVNKAPEFSVVAADLVPSLAQSSGIVSSLLFFGVIQNALASNSGGEDSFSPASFTNVLNNPTWLSSLSDESSGINASSSGMEFVFNPFTLQHEFAYVSNGVPIYTNMTTDMGDIDPNTGLSHDLGSIDSAIDFNISSYGGGGSNISSCASNYSSCASNMSSCASSRNSCAGSDN